MIHNRLSAIFMVITPINYTIDRIMDDGMDDIVDDKHYVAKDDIQ